MILLLCHYLSVTSYEWHWKMYRWDKSDFWLVSCGSSLHHRFHLLIDPGPSAMYCTQYGGDLCWWQKLFVDLTCFCQSGQVEIGEQIFCDLLWHRKGGLFPSWVGGREGNLSLDLHRAFLPLGFLTGSCSSLSAKEFLSSSQPQIHLQIFSSFPNELELSTEL